MPERPPTRPGQTQWDPARPRRPQQTRSHADVHSLDAAARGLDSIRGVGGQFEVGSQPPIFTFSELFAGLGGFRVALEALGGQCVFACENDRWAADTYAANHRGQGPDAGDICTVDPTSVRRHATQEGWARGLRSCCPHLPTTAAVQMPHTCMHY